MRALILCLLLLPLSGCFTEELAEARLVCDIDCNIQATVDPIERQANELTVAVNPTDPMNILVSGKDYNPTDAGDCVRDGVYVTHDGGATWANTNVAGSPWRLLNAPATFQPSAELSQYWCVTDPVLAFGPDGTAYWSIMPYQCDAASGSKTGDGIHPDGGFNDWLWSCSSMFVLVSDDGGATWPIVREVAFGPRLEHDKQWMSVAPDGTVLLCWDRDPSYQLGAFVPGDNPANQLSAPGYMVCSTSTDKGRSWSDVTDVNPEGTWDGFLPWVDWTADNVAWMAAIDASGQVIVSQSNDGLAWQAPVVVGSYVNPPADGSFGWPALNGSVFRTFALPTMAIDRSSGPHAGNLYVAWMDHAGSNADVLLTVSRDDGATWSPPEVIGDKVADDQFMPALSVGPDGTVDLVYYDTRYDPAMHLFDLVYTYSLDGGRSWADILRVSEVSVDEQYSHHQNGMIFMGDYIDMDSYDGHAVPTWVDTRNGKADAFIAIIERPAAR